MDIYKLVVSPEDVGKLFTITTSLQEGEGMKSLDTYLKRFSSNGILLASNDDAPGTRYSILSFTPTTAETF